MKSQNNSYFEIDEYLKDEEKKMNIIYKELLKNNQDKKSITKFDRIVKSKLDYKGPIPCSKSYEGETLLTLSKTWMIIILIKINKGKAQKNEFLTLVNSSLTHELNEYEEYKEFYEQQCEMIFSSEEARKQINLNPNLSSKLDTSITKDELRKYYIYLLFKPQYFKKFELDGISKNKKNDYKNKNISKDNKRQRNSRTKKSSMTKIELISDSEENDEKGDRLDEKDMISKNRAKKSLKGTKNKKSSNKIQKKNYLEDESLDYNKIINKRNSTIKRKDKTKKGKSQNKRKNSRNYLNKENNKSEETIEISEDEEYIKKNVNQKKLNDKKNNKTHEVYDEKEKLNKKENKRENRKDKKKKKEKEKEKKNRTSAERIYELLGIDKNLIEEESEEKDNNVAEMKKKTKKRSTSTVPKKKKEKQIKSKKNDSHKNQKKNKEKIKKEKKKVKSKTDDEDISFDEDSLDIFTNSNLTDDSNIYGDNLNFLSETEKIKLDNEIKTAMKGDLNEIDLEGILEDSNLEGISLDQLELELKSSKDISALDIDEESN